MLALLERLFRPVHLLFESQSVETLKGSTKYYRKPRA